MGSDRPCAKRRAWEKARSSLDRSRSATRPKAMRSMRSARPSPGPGPGRAGFRPRGRSWASRFGSAQAPRQGFFRGEPCRSPGRPASCAAPRLGAPLGFRACARRSSRRPSRLSRRALSECSFSGSLMPFFRRRAWRRRRAALARARAAFFRRWFRWGEDRGKRASGARDRAPRFAAQDIKALARKQIDRRKAVAAQARLGGENGLGL